MLRILSLCYEKTRTILVFLKKTLTPTIVRVNVLEMQTKPATKPTPR